MSAFSDSVAQAKLDAPDYQTRAGQIEIAEAAWADPAGAAIDKARKQKIPAKGGKSPSSAKGTADKG